MFSIRHKQQIVRSFRHILAIVFWAVLTTPLMAAAADSHRETAEEFLSVINFKQQLGSMGNRVTLPTKQRLSMVRTDPARAQLIRDHIGAIEALVNDELSWESNKAGYITIYTETFTEQELRSMIDFFKSDVGQKFLADKPEFNQRIATMTAEKMNGLKPRLDEMEKQLKQKMEALPKPENTSGQ